MDALANLKDRRSSDVLASALKRDADSRVRVHAAKAIAEIGDAASATLLGQALADPVPDVRYAAAEAFDDLHDLETAPPALIEAARSSDERLRKIAGLSLAEIHDPASLDALIGLVDSPDRDVREKVAEALGEIGSPKASAGLLRLMKDADPRVRRAATESLGEVNRGR